MIGIIFGIFVIGSLYAIERELREIKDILRELTNKNSNDYCDSNVEE